MPELKLRAIDLALQQRGFTSRLALPLYPLTRGAGDGEGTLLDLSDGEGRLALPEGADDALVRVRAAGGVSEARAMTALESIAARARGREVVVALALAGATETGTPLTALLDRLAANGVQVVVGAGDVGRARARWYRRRAAAIKVARPRRRAFSRSRGAAPRRARLT